MPRGYDRLVKFQTIKGTHDRLPDDAPAWRHVLETARLVLERSGAGEIHTPTFEDTGVFTKGVGASSDIVRKEMYSFSDKGERDLTLRPEATAPIVRAYLEHGMSSRPSPVKLWTFEPMFRAEKPQKGRQRQFYQLGLEIIGLVDPITDAETIDTGKHIFDALGVKDYVIHLGSVGDPEDRREYNAYLRDLLSPVLDRLSDDSRERLELNPLRILDSKDRGDQALLKELEVKPMLEFLGADAREHFEGVQEFLRAWDVPFVIDLSIVRGLDYYRRTAYEFIHNSPAMGVQSTILGGGRYDGLAELLGGPHTPGVGWGLGVERAILALEAEGIAVPPPERPLATVIPLDQDSFVIASRIARDLRWLGKVLGSYRVKGLGKALGDAEKTGSRFAVLIGSNERERGVVSVKNLETRDQVEVPLGELEVWFSAQI